MSPQEALEEVRKDLMQAFGSALAARIIDASRSMPSQEEIDIDSYRAAIASLCKDERVLGMFGELGVKDKRQRWEKLV